MPLRIRCVVLIVLVAVAGAGAAAAQSDPKAEDARAHYKRGMAAYALDDWEGALREFEAGFRKEPLPAFLYNMGQAHRMAGRPEQAIRFYRKYLELAPRASDRADVERLIAESEKTLEAQRRLTVQPPTGAVQPPAPEAAPKPGDAGPVDARPWYRDTPGLVLGVSGLAALAAGAGLLGGSAALDAQSASAVDLREKERLYDQAGAVMTGGAVTMGVGGALLIAAAVRLSLAARAAPSRKSVAWELGVGIRSGGGVLLVGGSF